MFPDMVLLLSANPMQWRYTFCTSLSKHPPTYRFLGKLNIHSIPRWTHCYSMQLKSNSRFSARNTFCAPTKLVLSSLRIRTCILWRLMKFLRQIKKTSVDRSSVTSRCMARTVRHVKKQPNNFHVDGQ